MAKAQKSAETIPEAKPIEGDAPSIDLTRFTLVDVEKWGIWLLGRMKEKWPHLDNRNYISVIRGCMESNDYLFMRSKNIVSLAVVQFEPLNPKGYVKEVFVLGTDDAVGDDALAEALAHYRNMIRWAKSMGFDELVVGRYTDVDLDALREAFGKFGRDDVFIIKV